MRFEWLTEVCCKMPQTWRWQSSTYGFVVFYIVAAAKSEQFSAIRCLMLLQVSGLRHNQG